MILRIFISKLFESASALKPAFMFGKFVFWFSIDLLLLILLLLILFFSSSSMLVDWDKDFGWIGGSFIWVFGFFSFWKRILFPKALEVLNIPKIDGFHELFTIFSPVEKL